MRELLKAMLKTGSGTAGTVVFGVLTAKVIAVLTGPSGIGLFSLLRQAQQTLAGIATMQGNTALVQGMSSREGASRDSYAGTVAVVFITVSTALSLCVWFFAPVLASMILGRQDPEGIWLIRGLVPNVLAAAAVLYLGALLNSYREIGRLAFVQVAGALGGAVAAYPLVHMVGPPWGLLFILWAIGIASLVAALVFSWRGGWLGPLCRSLFRLWDSGSARYFFRFAGVTIIAGLMISGSVLLVRALFMHHGGTAEAGIFDVAWTLSAAYLMLLLGSLGTYYTPVLAGTIDVQKRTELMSQVFNLEAPLDIVPFESLREMARQVEAGGVDRPLVGMERLGVDAAVEQVRRVNEVGIGQEKFQSDNDCRIRSFVPDEDLADFGECALDALQVVVPGLQALGVGRLDDTGQRLRRGQRVAVPGPGRFVPAHLV